MRRGRDAILVGRAVEKRLPLLVGGRLDSSIAVDVETRRGRDAILVGRAVVRSFKGLLQARLQR